MKFQTLSILSAAMLAGSLLARASDLNALVLEQIRTMPDGGGYATTREAHAALNSSVQPDAAKPILHKLWLRVCAQYITPSCHSHLMQC